jgi:hypothetical protein
MGIWTPNYLTSGFIPGGYSVSGTPHAHYKADAITGVANAATLTTWSDSSGNGNTLGQLAAKTLPKYYTNVQNGLPAVRSASDTTAMFISSWITAKATQPVTVFIVLKMASLAAYDVFFDGGNNDSDRCYAYGNTGDNKIHFAAGTDVDTGDVLDTNAHYFTFLFNGASSTARMDGAVIQAATNAGAQTLDGIVLFSNVSGSNGMIGDIYEVIVYDGNESPTENETMLATKWNI